MKKLTFFAVLAAAAMTAALSCSKEGNAPAVAGKTITVEVGGPVIEQEAQTAAALSRVAVTGTDLGSGYTFAWEAGESFHVINYTDDVKAYTDCGAFTTASGGNPASFEGSIPAGATYAKYVAFTCYNNNFTFSSSTTGKSVKFNIPSTQDGTGIKYSLFGTKSVKYKSEKLTITGMALRTALTRFDVPADADVRQITVTVDNAIKHTFGLCSSEDALDATGNIFDTKKFALSGATNKTVTIYDEGKLLSGPVYFVSRHINSDETNGTGTLTFVFTNGSGQTATKTVTLAKTVDETTTYYPLKGGELHYLGAVTFKAGDFK